jgi:hypothetical protein
MNIEQGKYYKTRDGRKAFVTAMLRDSPFSTGGSSKVPFRGWIDGSSLIQSWTDSGRRLEYRESPSDLVAEWVDPISIDLTVRLIERNGLTMVLVEPIQHARVQVIGVSQKMPGDVCIGSVQAKLIETPF